MKKTLCAIITTILLISCLGLTAFANESSIVVSEDYKTITMSGYTFTRFNAHGFEITYSSTLDNEIILSDTQKELVSDIRLERNEQKNIIYAEIYFKDGAILNATYLREDCFGDYLAFTNGEDMTYEIYFYYPERTTIEATKETLFGKQITLGSDVLEWCDMYEVFCFSEDKSLSRAAGALLIEDGKYYYVDFVAMGVTDIEYFYPADFDELPAYELTDKSLLADIKEVEEEYYSTDVGFLFNDSFTKTVSAIFLTVVFAVIPFVILVLFLIFTIRSKKLYRKLYGMVCILSGLELAIFATLSILMMIYN